MTGDDDVGDTEEGGRSRPAFAPRLSRVEGPLGPAEPPPEVRLCREWKGLTVADLLRDELVATLPGRVLSALRHIERGDLAAAADVLPGDAEEAPLLAGPGHRRRRRRRWLAAILIASALAAAAMVASLCR